MHHFTKRASRVSTSTKARVCSLVFRYTFSHSLISVLKMVKNCESQYTVCTPDVPVASAFVYLCPSQTAICSLVSFRKRISRCAGFLASGKITSMLSSWSMPLSQKRSEFCMNIMLPSALVGMISFALKTANAPGFSFFTKRLRFSIKSLELMGVYFIALRITKDELRIVEIYKLKYNL